MLYDLPIRGTRVSHDGLVVRDFLPVHRKFLSGKGRCCKVNFERNHRPAVSTENDYAPSTLQITESICFLIQRYPGDKSFWLHVSSDSHARPKTSWPSPYQKPESV